MRKIDIPRELKLSVRGSCVPAAMTLVRQLGDRDFVVQGYIKFGERGYWHEHTWMEVEGIHFDPTFEQFRKLRSFRCDLVRYREKERFQAGLYRCISLAKILREHFWRNRLKYFGGSV